GKHKPEYTQHVDTGDYIVVINDEQINQTGGKTTDKIYNTHSAFPGGIKSNNVEKLIANPPEHLIETALKDMLPNIKLRR
ncbi:50S ribosomal protein L13, partial [Pseudomonas syringae pv. tagetis]|uniref:50S ribosomal protein L13 n=1 Tax=Pseudomonas syringae group genomosp. 7 TaxID=251699 RepID=UPI00377045F3